MCHHARLRQALCYWVTFSAQERNPSINLYLWLYWISNYFFQWVKWIAYPLRSCKFSVFYMYWLKLDRVKHFDICLPSGYETVLHYGLNLYFPDNKREWLLFNTFAYYLDTCPKCLVFWLSVFFLSVGIHCIFWILINQCLWYNVTNIFPQIWF
jgi:hypothetical protein